MYVSLSFCIQVFSNTCFSKSGLASLKTTMYNNINIDILLRSGCASSPDPFAIGTDLNRCEKNCLLCTDQLNPNTAFTSSVTGERFLFDSSGLSGKACNTKNVVYLVTCDLCGVQYVGMTTQTLKGRFYGHRGAIKRGNINVPLYNHFSTSNGHTERNCKVQIIYVCGESVDNVNKTLLSVEEYFMIKLGTVAPFGLNDKIESKNLVLSRSTFDSFHKFNTPYFTFPSERRKRSHGHRKNSHSSSQSSDVFHTLGSILDLYNNYKLNKLYVLLRSLSHSFINNCLGEIDNCFGKYHTNSTKVESILLAYRSRFIIPSKKQESDDYYVYCSIPFIHSAFEDVGFDSVFKRKEIKELLPLAVSECTIRPTFSYGPTIGRKLFNYNKILNVISSRDLKKLKYNCSTHYADFVYAPHGHVHTGCLDIVTNNSLRDVMAKGAKFRLKPSVSKAKILATIESCLCLLYTSPSPRDRQKSRMPSSA